MSSYVKRIGKILKRRHFTRLDNKAYISAYAQDSDRRISSDPKKGIGGLWDEMGELQFSFLKSQGLLPEHRILDIGCGTLRAGRFFIPYLNQGNYTGFDISRRAIEFGEDMCRQANFAAKKPRLLLLEDGELNFASFSEQYDFLLAQSVFTHLREYHLEQCFSCIGNVMNDKSKFFFTYYDSPNNSVIGYKSFSYSIDYIKEVAKKNDFILIPHPEYAHPRGQVMLEARRAQS